MSQDTIKNYFPNYTELDKKLKSFCLNLDNDLILSVCERQIYSERERYHIKKEVDSSLLSSIFVEGEGNLIKEICDNSNICYIDNYLALLEKNLSSLISICFDFLENFELYKDDSSLFEDFLIRYLKIADIDNSHAMYLSSDNWDFSVFNNILNKLSVKYGTSTDFQNILKGNILDIRTVAYLYKNKYNFTENKGVSFFNTIKDFPCVEDNFIMPIILYQFMGTNLKSIPKIEIFETDCEFVNKYQDLYYARFLYDSLEYFGFYAFVRNLIAEICEKSFSKDIASFITLYQFYDAYLILKK